MLLDLGLPRLRNLAIRASELAPFLSLGKLQRLVNIIHKVVFPASELNDAAAPQQMPDLGIMSRSPTKEDTDTSLPVVPHDLLEHLRSTAVERRHAVDVKYDVTVPILPPQPRQRWMSHARTVQLQPPQPCLHLPGVRERQGLGDLDNKAPLDELETVQICLGVLKAVSTWNTAENLDAWACSVADDL